MILLAVIAYYRFSECRRDIFLCALSVGLTFIASFSLKQLFHIARPIDALIQIPRYGFPSTHAAFSMAIAV
ncbi:phosphatase PAP2 family protein, partial [Bifidobacterium pullorum]|uniref:hypothetical protein n=1 Tax=Bifidobacterium pullorum TaxID=78448 RepID=UPI00195BBAE8